MEKKHTYLLISCLMFGLITDYLFYGKYPGISFPIFILLFYGLFFLNNRKELKFNLCFEWALTIPILLLSFTYLIYSNVVFKLLNIISIFTLLIIQTLLLTKTNKFKWYRLEFLEDMAVATLIKPFSKIGEPFILIKQLLKNKTNNNSNKNKTVGKVLKGLLISCPLLLIVVSLLASADDVFKNVMSGIPNIFQAVNASEFITRFLIIMFIAGVLFSYIFNCTIQENKYETQHEVEIKKVWNPVTVTTVLTSTNIIYIIFVVIQFAYLFGGVRPSNLTYAEYARKGFFELVMVTLINLCVLNLSLNFTKTEGAILDKFIKFSNSVLVICTSIMLFSAHFRMSLYERIYGYTYLRILTHTFMIFIFLLLIVSFLKIWKQDISIMKAYLVITIVFYTALNYMNIDVIIAKNNVDRYLHGGKNIDISYLTNLSYDSVQYTVKLLNIKDKNLKTEIENSLYKQQKELKASYPWQSFNISKYNAKKTLSKYRLKYIEQGSNKEYIR